MLRLSKNCWFCNQNSKVKFFERNGWTCAHCEQYNGFKEDGDYNREISEMFSDANDSMPNRNPFFLHNRIKTRTSTNCLCERCNFNQQKKLEKLSNFKPRSEETYDLEISLYKEYLEKIYDLCNNCKSRVKFEITKQDGMLKQYLYRIGKFDYLFEFNRFSKMRAKSTNDKLNTDAAISFSKRLTDSAKQPARILAYFLIFILCTLTQIYNHYESNETSDSKMNNSLRQTYEIYESEYFQPLNNVLRDKFEKLLEQQLNLSSRESLHTMPSIYFKFFNSNLHNSLLILYMLSCFLTLTSSRHSFRFDKLIWLLSIVFNLANCEHLLKFFSSTANSTETSPQKPASLHLITILAPLVQIVILAEFLKASYDRIVETNDSNNQNAKNTNFNLFNFTNISTPFDCKNSIPDLNNNWHLMNNFVDNRDAKSIIRPARFLPKNISKSVYQFRTLENGAASSDNLRVNELDEDDDSSSIVSGITNLYLNKTSNSVKSICRPSNNNRAQASPLCFGTKSNQSEKLTSYYNYNSTHYNPEKNANVLKRSSPATNRQEASQSKNVDLFQLLVLVSYVMIFGLVVCKVFRDLFLSY